MNDIYYTIPQYIECQTTLLGKIQAYDKIIEGMELAYLEAVTSGHLSEYSMDDGQMKVRAIYRSITDMNMAIQGLEQIRQRYINRYNGRVRVMRSGNL